MYKRQELSFVVPQIDCDGQEDRLTQKVSETYLVKQQIPHVLKLSDQEDRVTKNINEQWQQKSCASRIINQTADSQQDVLTIEPSEHCLIKEPKSLESSPFVRTSNSQEDVLTEKVNESCLVDMQSHLVDKKKADSIQKNVISSLAVVQSSTSPDHPSCSEMPEQTQQVLSLIHI